MIKISFTDFWQGFNEENNIITNILRDIFETEIVITRPRKADICFVTIYGPNHKKIIKRFPEKCFLFLGENVRPNSYDVRYSLSCDFNDYQKSNMRLPLWYLEIDWFNTNLGTIKVNEIEKKLLNPGNLTPDILSSRKDCITIFNNQEGTRMDMYKKLKNIMEVDSYGKPFNNWFPTYSDYKSKIIKMGNYKFNFCPENSLYPGYYTEKCFHAKLAGCVPIYFAEPHVEKDFRKESFINLYDFLDFNLLEKHLKEIKDDYAYIAKLINEPLLNEMPRLDEIKKFLYETVKTLIN